ncbi:MAG: hypothetical protein IKL55_06555 [Clostridia bacterium]|nr:hypothetical protein [Clostridia bacterium]
MENEILLATSDGFYYKGTPSGEISFGSTKDSYSTSETIGKNTGLNSQGINRVIMSMFDVVPVVLIIIGILYFFKGISNIKNNRKKSELFSEDLSENLHSDGSSPINGIKKGPFRYFIISVVVLIIGMLFAL